MTQVSDNPDKGRFELDLGGQVVFARYARHGSVLVIPYVEAPPALRCTVQRPKVGWRAVFSLRDGGCDGRFIRPTGCG